MSTFWSTQSKHLREIWRQTYRTINNVGEIRERIMLYQTLRKQHTVIQVSPSRLDWDSFYMKEFQCFERVWQVWYCIAVQHVTFVRHFKATKSGENNWSTTGLSPTNHELASNLKSNQKLSIESSKRTWWIKTRRENKDSGLITRPLPWQWVHTFCSRSQLQHTRTSFGGEHQVPGYPSIPQQSDENHVEESANQREILLSIIGEKYM